MESQRSTSSKPATFWMVTQRVMAPANYTAEQVETVFDEALDIAADTPKWTLRRLWRADGVARHAQARQLEGQYEDEYGDVEAKKG